MQFAHMLVFLAGMGLFMFAFATHVAIWRIRVPRDQGTTLLLIFLAAFVGALLLLVSSWGMPIRDMIPRPHILLILLLFGSLCSVYFILFSAIEASSPTLTMIGQIFRSGLQGIGRDKLLKEAAENAFARHRIDELLRDGMVVVEGGKLRATWRGRTLVRPILFYRRLLGRSEAGG